MKRALRVILPIMLTLLILASSIWYLLFYDPGFTRDTILATARGLDKDGHHKMAAWLYDMAYRQSGGGDEVAIELANHYKSIGNYTKAEYTLSSAISDGGTPELYIALCQTYVEQDKILDAVNMLSNIKDPAVKEQLDAIRPAAPTFDPAPGFYSQYITVTVTGDGSDLYINTAGEYPSTSNVGRVQDVVDYATDLFISFFNGDDPTAPPFGDLSSASATLPQGETTIYAVAIDDRMLVSELSIQGYTIGGVIEQIKLSDPKLDEHIRGLLNFNAGREIYSNDLWKITELTLPEGITDFSDLQHFSYLQKLSIVNCGSADLSSIAKLSELKELSIIGGELSQDSLKAIGTLRTLEKLTLSKCGLSSIAPLEGLTALTYLDLSDNTLRNIGIFAGFTKLQELHMSSNALTDLEAMANLTDLKILDISFNSLQSLKPLYGITGLQELSVANNALQDIAGIGALTALTTLDLNQNILTDISPLSGCTALIELDISNNKLEEIPVIEELTGLVRLVASHNEIANLPNFEDGHALASLDISYNLLTNIDSLRNLNDLYFVDIDYNEKVYDLEPLVDCHKIMQVNCYGTDVAYTPFPANQGVVVNMDPTESYG